MVAYVFVADFIKKFAPAVIKKTYYRQSNSQDCDDYRLHVPSLSNLVDLFCQFNNESRIVAAVAVLPCVKGLLNQFV